MLTSHIIPSPLYIYIDIYLFTTHKGKFSVLTLLICACGQWFSLSINSHRTSIEWIQFTSPTQASTSGVQHNIKYTAVSALIVHRNRRNNTLLVYSLTQFLDTNRKLARCMLDNGSESITSLTLITLQLTCRALCCSWRIFTALCSVVMIERFE